MCPTFFDAFDGPVADPRWRQSFDASSSDLEEELVITVAGALNDEFVTMSVGSLPASAFLLDPKKQQLCLVLLLLRLGSGAVFDDERRTSLLRRVLILP